MKYKRLLLSTLLITALPLSAVELPKSLTEQASTTKSVSQKSGQSNAIISYAAKQLGMSEETVSAGLGSLFKVAKDNLSKENFSMVSSAIPGIDNYINSAPKEKKSSFSSMFDKAGDAGKTASSLSYLDSAFKKLGIPKEQVPVMLDTVNGYLKSNGYGDAADLLSKGLSFL